MKKLLFVFVFTTVASLTFAQQDAQFSQNMFNRLAVNPGFAGANNSICGTLLGRQQWIKFSGNGGTPQTYLLSLDAPVPVLHGGIGLNVMQDKIGRENTLAVNLAYSFRQALGPGTIGIGINGGILNKQINANGWITPDTDYQSDGAIPSGNVSNMVFDMGFGIYYNIANQLYFGVSSTHLPASTISSSGGTFPNTYNFNWDTKRHYYIMAGYSYAIGGSGLWDLKPSVFVKTDATSAQVDLNCNLMYNRMFWGGVTYRHKDAIIPMIGFQQSSGLKVGVAYDVTTSALKNTSTGGRTNTFEVMLGYCYKIPEKVVIQKKKNVRFL